MTDLPHLGSSTPSRDGVDGINWLAPKGATGVSLAARTQGIEDEEQRNPVLASLWPTRSSGVLPYAFSLVIMLIADLDRLGEGFINVSREVMLDLRSALRPLRP